MSSKIIKHEALPLFTFSVLFALVCLPFLSLTSCSNVSGKNENASAASRDEYGTSPDTADINRQASECIPPNLEAIDYGGKFNILVRDITGYIEEAEANEINGEILNDAIYERNAAVESKYNIDIEIKRSTGKAYLNTVKNSVLAGDKAYDMLYVNGDDAYALAMAGCLMDMNAVPHIGLNKTWWSGKLLEDSSVNHKNYFAVSDMNLQTYNSLQIFMFNKKLAESYDIGDIYRVVEDGKWTYDRMIETAKKVSGDADGDGKMGRDDIYGIGNVSSSAVILPYGAGLYFVDKDKNDVPHVNLTPKMTDFFIRIVKDLSDESYSFYIDRPLYTSERMTIGQELFFDDRLLLLRIDLGGLAGYRGYDSDFGILPVPKYDEEQKTYVSIVHPTIMTGAAVPAVNGDLDKIGRLLEDMAYQSYLTLRPKYIEYCVKGKYSRDAESAVVLDIILDNYGLDLAFAFSNSGLNIVSDMRTLMNNFDENIVSAFEKNNASYSGTLSEIVNKLQ